MPWLLRNIWTWALLLFTIITFSTFFITKVWQVRDDPYNLVVLSNLTNTVAGYHCGQSCWYLLGCCLLGTVRHHHGGMCLIIYIVEVSLIGLFPVFERARARQAYGI